MMKLRHFYRHISSAFQPKILLLFLILPLAIRAGAATQQNWYRRWYSLADSKLLAMAKADVRTMNNCDTALVCYSIITHRETDSNRRAVLDAYLGLWRIYFYHFYDYNKCFECLQKARVIADELGQQRSLVSLYQGCMYQTIGEEACNHSLLTKAYNDYLNAFSLSTADKDRRTASVAFMNLVYVAYLTGNMPAMTAVNRRYQALGYPANDTIALYNSYMYNAFNCISKRQFAAALTWFDRQIALIQPLERSPRMAYFTLTNKAKLLIKTGSDADVAGILKKAEAIAVGNDMKDFELEVYGLLADCYKRSGDNAGEMAYRKKLYDLKDTLMSYRQLVSASEMEYQDRLQRAADQMKLSEEKRQRMTVIIIVAVVFVVVVLSFLVVLFRKNRELNRNNRALYERNVELLRSEESERRLREQVHRERKDMNADVKAQLLQQIEDVMENSPEIYSVDFSLERLTSLVNSKYKLVSQAIHEEYGCNFNAYLNKYRIREACRQFNSPETYGNLTIEAIANNVGFKSRSSFVRAFKSATGLTPSAYQQQALQHS